MTDADRSELFDRMRESYALVGELGIRGFKSAYWQTLLSQGRQGYGGKGDFIGDDALWSDFRNNVITKGLDNANVPDDAVARTDRKIRAMYDALTPRIPGRLRKFLDESPVGRPHVLEADGLRLTQSSIEYTYMLSHLEPHLEETRVVVDIGGGYGGLARLIKLARPDVKLVLLDLPEVSAIQTYFLATAFPDCRVRGLSDVFQEPELDPRNIDTDFLVLPGQLIERIAPGSFDLAINTRSMMEMDLETVGFYLGHIQQRLAVGGAFFCLNRYEKKTRLKDYPFDERWYVSYSEPWPELIDQNPHHELIAVRTRHPVRAGLKEHVAGFPPFDSRLDRVKKRFRSSLS